MVVDVFTQVATAGDVVGTLIVTVAGLSVVIGVIAYGAITVKDFMTKKLTNK